MSFVTKLLAALNFSDKTTMHVAIKFWSLCNFRQRGRSRAKKIFFIFTLTFLTFYLTCSFIYVFLNFEYKFLIEFIQLSSFDLGVYTLIVYVFQQKQWEEIFDLVEEIEEESISEPESHHAPVVYRHRKYSQCVTFCFYTTFFLVFASHILPYWFSMVLFPGITGKNSDKPFEALFKAALPFDQSSHRQLSGVMQVFYSTYSCFAMWSWDTLLLSGIFFFMGQLKALRTRCVHALDSNDEQESLKNIIKCQNHYVSILKCYSKFKSVITWVAFPHFLQISLVYCVCMIKIVFFSDNSAKWIWDLNLLLGLNFQLVLYYGAANEIIIQSELLSSGVYESEWVSASPRVRRITLLESIVMRQRLAFSAGPFREMSLETVFAIWKLVYSFYTLLSQLN